jgi:hypothetical protein
MIKIYFQFKKKSRKLRSWALPLCVAVMLLFGLCYPVLVQWGPYQMLLAQWWTPQPLEPGADAFLLLLHGWSSSVLFQQQQMGEQWPFVPGFFHLAQTHTVWNGSVHHLCLQLESLCGYSKFCPLTNRLPSLETSSGCLDKHFLVWVPVWDVFISLKCTSGSESAEPCDQCAGYCGFTPSPTAWAPTSLHLH